MASKKSEGAVNEVVTLEGEVLAAVKDGHIVAFSKTEAALLDLKEKYGDPSKFDVTTTAGLEEGKKAVKTMVTYRTSLEKMREELKKPVLERGRLIDAEAKRITAELEKIETPLAAHVNAEVLRLKAIEEEKAKAEEERVTALQARLQRIKEAPLSLVGAPIEKLKVVRNGLASIVFSEFQEFEDSAKLYQESALNAIDGMIQTAEHGAKAYTQAKILTIMTVPSSVIGKPVEEMRAALASLQADKLEWAGDMLESAITTRASAVTQLHNLIAGQEQMDAMRAQLAALQPVKESTASMAAMITGLPDTGNPVTHALTIDERELLVGDEGLMSSELTHIDGSEIGNYGVSDEEASYYETQYESPGEIQLDIEQVIEQVIEQEKKEASLLPHNPIESEVADAKGKKTVIGKNEIFWAVHKQWGVSIADAAAACANAFKAV